MFRALWRDKAQNSRFHRSWMKNGLCRTVDLCPLEIICLVFAKWSLTSKSGCCSRSWEPTISFVRHLLQRGWQVSQSFELCAVYSFPVLKMKMWVNVLLIRLYRPVPANFICFPKWRRDEGSPSSELEPKTKEEMNAKQVSTNYMRVGALRAVNSFKRKLFQFGEKIPLPLTTQALSLSKCCEMRGHLLKRLVLNYW